MNRLLDPVRAIVADLIRKRLWPVALVLVIALVAVPALIASSSSEAPSGTAAVTPTPPAPAPATAPAEATSESDAERGGRVRDPFFDPPAMPGESKGQESGAASADAPAKAVAKEPGATKPEAKAKADAPTKAGAPTKARAPTKATPNAPAQEARPTPPPATGRSAPVLGTHYRTAARVGSAAGATTRPLARLTPIGRRSDPAALYLGVMKVGTPYAVFVLGRHSTSDGEATCAADTHCRIMGLLPGDSETITVRRTDGRPARRIVLRVASVRRVRTSAATARTMRAKVHPYGRTAMRAMSRSNVVAEALGRLGYRRSTGLLYSIAAAEALEKATP